MAEVIKTVIDVELNTGKFSAELKALQQQVNAFNLTLNKSSKAQGQASKIWADDLSKLINRTGFFKAELSKIQTSAAALDNTLKKGQATLGQFFSAAFNRRSAMAAEVFALAAERARTMQTQFIATGKAAKGMQDVLAIRPLTAFSSQISIASQRMEILSSMFKQGTTQLINFGKNVQWAGRQLMVGFTVPLTIFGTTAGRVFMDLEKQVVSFRKVYGDLFTSPQELEDNLNAVKGLAKEYTKYGVAVKDTVALAAQAAAAGRQNQELTDAVAQATRLSTLGQLDQNQALETTIALQSAFRLSGKELADTINFLNMVENQTVVSLQDLSAAIPRVAPVIRGLGGDVKDMAVFLAAMQEGGVSAEQGANALKSGLASLINPTKGAKEMLAGFNVNLDAIIQKNRGDLMGTVMDFARALQTLDEFSRQQALEEVFGKFQYARLGALFENIVRDGSQASQVMDTMGYSAQQLAVTADKELSAIENSFATKLTAAIEQFKLAIAPIGELFVRMAIPVINMITKLANWFNSLPEGTKNIIAVATAITGLVVPAATMMFGLFMNLVGTLAKMSQGAAIFGATLLRRGPIAALQSLTQSSKYLSLAEIDASNAARQLGEATQYANVAIANQSSTMNSSRAAVDAYTSALMRMISAQAEAALVQPAAFKTGSSAAAIALSKGKVKKFNKGSIVPGTGNTDTVPAMLTPGEFVVNKQSTKNNLGLLNAINMNKGGGVAKPGKLFYGTKQPFGFAGKEEELSATIQAGLSRGTATQYNIAKNSAFSMEGLLFSGGGPLENRKAYAAFTEAMRLLDGNNAAQEKLYKEIVARRKTNGKVNAQAVKKGWAQIASSGIIDEVSILDAAGKSIKIKASDLNLDSLLSFTEKSHIGSRIQTLPYDLPLTNGTIVPAGTPVQFLNNKVLDISDSINKKLSKAGVSKTEMIDYFKGNKIQLFGTLNDQFRTYVDGLGVPEDVKRRILDQYRNSRDAIFDTYIKEFDNLPDGTIISDRGQGTTKKLEDISNKAFSNLSSAGKELKDFDKLISYEQNLRIAPKEYLLKEATKLVKQGKASKDVLKAQSGDILKAILVARHGENSPIVNDFLKNALEPTKKGGLKVKAATYLKQNLDDLSQTLKNILPKIVYSRTKLVTLNKGNIVPGSGNTDTVPAMLTPGEFVVNKKATQGNLPLLKAINGGKVRGYQDGGEVLKGLAPSIAALKAKNPNLTTPQALSILGVSTKAVAPVSGFKGRMPGVAGGVAGMIASAPVFGMVEQLGGVVQTTIAGMLTMSAVSKAVSISLKAVTKQPIKLSEEFSLLNRAFKLFRIPLTGATLGWAGLAAGAVALGFEINKQRNNILNAGAKLTEAMYGSADTLGGLAQVFGTKTAKDRVIESRIARAGGGISEESKQFATQYIQSDPGKELLQQIELIKKAGGDAAQGIRNQLVTGVISGVITPDQAKAIASDIGLALKDEQLAINATAQIAKLIGPNGELLQNNLLSITAQIIPKINTQELLKEAEQQYEEGGFLGKIFGSKQSMITENAIRNLKERMLSANETISQSIASVTEQYDNQEITYTQYKQTLDSLNKDLLNSNEDTINSFTKLTGIAREDLNDLYSMKITKGATGTEMGVQAQKVQEFFNTQRQEAEALLVEPLGEKLTDQVSNAIFTGVAGGDVVKASEIFAQVLTGNMSPALVAQIVDFLNSQGLTEAAKEFQNKFTPKVPDASSYFALQASKKKDEKQQTDTNDFPTTPGPESAFSRIMKETAATKQYTAAVKTLLKDGIAPENVALLKQDDLLEMNNSQRKKIIEKLKEQQDATKVLQYVMLSTEDRNIKNLQDDMKIIDRNIGLNQRRIDDVLKLNKVEEDRMENLKRQNDLDSRQIALRNKALDSISKKEDEINKVYDARFTALDEITKINDRMQQQREGQIALAGALTGGDFGAAAQAASQLTSQFANAQLEDTRAALEQQKTAELAALTAEVNGNLFTRVQLEQQIDQIGEVVYQRNLLIQSLEDTIYAREQEIKPFKEAINKLEQDRITLARQLEDAEYNKWKTELDNLKTATAGWEKYWSARRTGKSGGSIGSATRSSASGQQTQNKKYGGMIGYRGSNESPPGLLKANTGMEVPGIGMMDKVPALLTPGEFVVRKSAAQANMPLLKAINSNVFPNSFGMTPSMQPIEVSTSVSNISSPVYNYNVNVNVADTNASPNDIADVVISKIRMNQNRRVRGTRF